MRIDVFKIEMSAPDDVRELKKLIDLHVPLGRRHELWPVGQEVTQEENTDRQKSRACGPQCLLQQQTLGPDSGSEQTSGRKSLALVPADRSMGRM